jgi:hypothetical protein
MMFNARDNMLVFHYDYMMMGASEIKANSQPKQT